IKSKTLRTCLPAAITLGYDNKRVVRILYMAAKLDFSVDQEIIDWVKQGKTDGEIAIILSISQNTVKSHLKHVFEKLNVTRRAQAVAKLSYS
ncbi:MAG: helix-turn-helix transcriptional regulator, partial [Pseudomonadota bacterium]